MTLALINANSRPWLEGKLPDGVEPLWFEDAGQLMALAPRAEAAESVDDAGRFRFDVRIDLPGVGRLVRYRGWLVEEEPPATPG